MNDARAVETFLARLYTDTALRNQFLARPQLTARAAGLSDTDTAILATIDRAGLAAATLCLASKRAARPKESWWSRWRRLR